MEEGNTRLQEPLLAGEESGDSLAAGHVVGEIAVTSSHHVAGGEDPEIQLLDSDDSINNEDGGGSVKTTITSGNRGLGRGGTEKNEKSSSSSFEPLETVQEESAGGFPNSTTTDEVTTSRRDEVGCLSLTKAFLVRWVSKWQYILLFPLLMVITTASLIWGCIGSNGYVDLPAWTASLLFVQFVLLWLALLLLEDDRPLQHLDVAGTYVALIILILRGEQREMIFTITHDDTCFFDDYFYRNDLVRLMWLSLTIQSKKTFFQDNNRKQQILVVVCAILSFCTFDFLAMVALAVSFTVLFFGICPCCRDPMDAVRRLEVQNNHNNRNNNPDQPHQDDDDLEAMARAGSDAEALQARLERQMEQLGGPVGAGSAFLQQELSNLKKAVAFLVVLYFLIVFVMSWMEM